VFELKQIIILTTAIILSLGLACSGDSGDTSADGPAKWGSAKWGEGKWNP